MVDQNKFLSTYRDQTKAQLLVQSPQFGFVKEPIKATILSTLNRKYVLLRMVGCVSE